MSAFFWDPVIPRPGDNAWNLSLACNALYESPKDSGGKYTGPLVPYAGKDSQGRNLVGYLYYNFAKVEEHPAVVEHFAKDLASNIRLYQFSTGATIVGIPDGGRTFGQALAAATKRRFVYPLKVKRPRPPGAVKDEYDLVFSRQDLHQGEAVILVDDVHNNFNNTDDTIEVITKLGARVVGLCSVLNRSPKIDQVYTYRKGTSLAQSLPVYCVIRKPMDEYECDDPVVAEHFRSGNIETEVKKNWARLKKVMEEGKTSRALT